MLDSESIRLRVDSTPTAQISLYVAAPSTVVAATKSASGPGSASTFALRLGPSNAQQFRGAPWRLSPIPRPDQFLITRRNKLDLKSMRLRLGWVLACVSHED